MILFFATDKEPEYVSTEQERQSILETKSPTEIEEILRKHGNEELNSLRI